MISGLNLLIAMNKTEQLSSFNPIHQPHLEHHNRQTDRQTDRKYHGNS